MLPRSPVVGSPDPGDASVGCGVGRVDALYKETVDPRIYDADDSVGPARSRPSHAPTGSRQRTAVFGRRAVMVTCCRRESVVLGAGWSTGPARTWGWRPGPTQARGMRQRLRRALGVRGNGAGRHTRPQRRAGTFPRSSRGGLWLQRSGFVRPWSHSSSESNLPTAMHRQLGNRTSRPVDGRMGGGSVVGLDGPGQDSTCGPSVARSIGHQGLRTARAGECQNEACLQLRALRQPSGQSVRLSAVPSSWSIGPGKAWSGWG